jgi:hypothetical protein
MNTTRPRLGRHYPLHPEGACKDCDGHYAAARARRLARELQNAWMHNPHALVLWQKRGDRSWCTCGRRDDDPLHNRSDSTPVVKS